MFQRKLEISGHAGAIYCCLVSDGFVYSGGADHYLTRWDLSTGDQDKFAIKFEHSVYAIEMIENKILVVGLSSGDLHFFDIEERKEIKYFTQHKKAIFSIACNKLKNQLFVTDAEGNLSVWNTLDYSLMIYLPLDCGKVRRIAISHNGDKAALACQDGFIRIIETEYFNEIKTIEAHKDGATSVLFHHNENLLISGGKDALIKVWDWGKESLIETIIAHNYAVYDLIELYSGNIFVSASRDKKIKIWNAEDFSFTQRLEIKQGGHKHSVNDLSVVNQKEFVSCSDDKKIIVWSMINE